MKNATQTLSDIIWLGGLSMNLQQQTCYMEVSSLLMLVYVCVVMLLDIDDFRRLAEVLMVTADLVPS